MGNTPSILAAVCLLIIPLANASSVSLAEKEHDNERLLSR
jgi:hypothetical protein